jgi:Domain of unknown function (DUF5916)/Carbohydrate family 9 binding domain-like
MPIRRTMRMPGLPALLLLLVLSPSLDAKEPPAPPAPPAVTAGQAAAPIVLDGALAEPAWAAAGVIADLTQQSPVPGRPTAYRTRVRVLADDETLYIGVECMDPHPEEIAVHTLQRDADLTADDNLTVVLDTFGDGRTGYLFRINAAGARQDGLISAASGATYDWDGIWDARTRRTAGGWTAEIAIPARTLRFHRGVDHWGFNVERYIARDRLTLRWAGTTLDATLADLARAGRLDGIGGLRQGLGLSAAPYGLVRYDHQAAPPLARHRGNAGFDLGYNLTPGLGGVLTVHTDFAETEVDAQQINLTRFPLFFPEKRAFFLEGSNLFDFATGLGTDFLPFYSRRVGLVGGAVVPLDEGLKLLGRTGRWSLAALDVQTGASAAAPATNLFAGRATYDVDSHLRLGTLLTNGDPTGLGTNTFGSFDAVWRTSTFRGDKNLLFSAWGARSEGTTPADRPAAGGASGHDGWGLRAEYPNDLFDTYAQVNQYGGALDPALGFLPRPGTRQLAVGNAFQPRPAEQGPFGWARQFFFETYYTRVDDPAGRPESWRLFTAPFNVSLRSGEHLEMDYAPQFERLDLPFEVARGVVIPPGRYRFDRYEVEAQSSAARPLRVGSNLWFGGFYGGTLLQWTWFLYATGLGGHLRVELNGENDFGRLPQGRFVQRLWQWKVLYAFTPDLTVSTFTQYDSEVRGVGLNSRLRWTVSPGRDLFLVWNRNWAQEAAPGLRLTPAADQLTLKLRWTVTW